MTDDRRGPGPMVYALLCVVSAYCIMQSLPPHTTPLPIVLVVLTAVLLVLRLWVVTPLLLVFQAALFAGEVPTFDGSRHTPAELFTAAAVLTLVIATARFLRLCPPVITWSDSVWGILKRTGRVVSGRGPAGPVDPGRQPRDGRLFRGGEVATALLRVTVCVLLAATILTRNPVRADAPDYARLVPTALRTITIGLGLLVAAVLGHSLLSLLAWRRRSPREARLFLRGELLKACHRELTAAYRRPRRYRFPHRADD